MKTPVVAGSPAIRRLLAAAEHHPLVRRRRDLLRRLAALTLAALTLTAGITAANAATDAPPSRNEATLAAVALLEDTDGRLQIGDVADGPAAARFAPLAPEQPLNLGYSHATWWLRLDIAAPAPALHYLEIGHPPLDDVQLFVATAGGGYRRLQAGDLAARAAWPLPGRAAAFPLELAAGTNTLYLRVRSEGNLTVPIALLAADRFLAHQQTTYAGHALYFGILLALGAYNLLLYLSLREQVYLDYILFLAAMALGIGTLNGFTGQFVWPSAPAWANAALPAGMALSGLLAARFVRAFLATREIAPLLDAGLRFFIAWFAGAIALTAVSYQLAEKATSLGSIFFCILAWAGGWHCLRRGYAGARYFLLAWTALLAGSLMLAARNFDWVPTNAVTSNGFQIGSALEMLLLSFALADRITVLRRANERAAQQLLAAQEETVEALRRSETVLEARVAERTAALNEANRRLEVLTRRDPLTGLGNRNELERAWEVMLSRTAAHDPGIVLLLLDLDGFKPINDRHGHETGDRILKEVAKRLQDNIRETDAVVRLGGDEFVVLVDDMARDDELAIVVSKIRAAIARPFAVGSLDLSVGVSIGAAHYPGDGMTLKELLHRADIAMYGDKARSRDDAPRDGTRQPA